MKFMTVDNHPLFRQHLKHLIREIDPDAEISEAQSFNSALDEFTKHGPPDLILLNLLMPDMNAFDGLLAVKERAPDTPIVVVSMIDSREDVLHAIELGADGYIPKSASAIEFVGALETVIAGQIYLPPELFRKDYERSQPSCSSSAQPCFAANRPRVLTWRQREVVDLIRGGLGNAEIAERLGISKQTVRMHVSRILKQQNLENRTQVALLAVQERTPDTPIIVDTMIDSREDVLHAANRPRVLTWRQREVVDLIRDGLGNAEIAERSGISESTVKVHVSQILNQLNLKNRTQVALFAVQERDESQPKDLIKARMEAELLSKVGDGGFRRRVGADGCSAVVAEESPHDAQPVRLAMPPPMMAKKDRVMPSVRQR